MKGWVSLTAAHRLDPEQSQPTIALVTNTKSLAVAIPSWIGASGAVFTAIVVYRVGCLLLRYFFFWLSGAAPAWFVVNFLYPHQDALPPVLSVAAGVLAARWMERKLSRCTIRFAVLASLALMVLAFFPVRVHLWTEFAKVSPLDWAIRRNYPLPIIEGLLDRFPHLVNRAAHEQHLTSPLGMAAFEEKTNLVQLLIQRGANVDVAIEEMLSLDNTNAVQLLLDCARANGKATHRQEKDSESNKDSSGYITDGGSTARDGG